MNKLKDTVAIRFVMGECRVKLVLSRFKLACLTVAGFIELVRNNKQLGQRLAMSASTEYGLFERFDDGIECMIPDSSLLLARSSSRRASVSPLNRSSLTSELVLRPKTFYELKGKHFKSISIFK